jgi:hypothetical protein
MCTEAGTGMISKRQHKFQKKESRSKASRENVFTSIEERAARAKRIQIEEAEPHGWIAHSESGDAFHYLYYSKTDQRLVCTCADYIFRGEEINHQCKHVLATLLFIAEKYLMDQYSR